jgi:hypothetical protein
MIGPSLVLSLLTAMLASELSHGASATGGSRTAPTAQQPLEEIAMEKQQAIEEARRRVGNELNGL